MELDLRDYIRLLRRRRWILVAAVAVCVGGASLATALTTRIYRAQAILFVGQTQIAANELQAGVQVAQLSRELLQSYARIIRTKPIAERAVREANLPVSAGVVAGVRADPILDTRLIQVSFTSPSRDTAQRVVNAVAGAFADEVTKIETPTGQREAAVKVSIVEPAQLPGAPVQPQPGRNIALGLLLGMTVGLGLAFLADYLDTTLKGPEDIEELSGVPVLAAIPRIQMTEGEVHIEIGGQSVASEAFRKLRTTIQFLGVDRPLRVIQVTSPYAGEGKTTTALNLAASFANAGLRVILVEADLRRPTLHHVFPSDANVGAGLTTALIGSIPIEDAILPTRIENLFHVPAGAIPPNPAELLSSDRMESVLRELRERADVVIVDSPPLLPVADAASVAPRADGVIMIVRSGETHRDRLRQAASLLVKVGGRPLGVVINAVGPQDTYYGYYDYYYSAYSSYSSYRSTPTISETRPTRPRRLGWGKGGAADGRGAMVPAGAVSDSGREGPGPSSSADGAGAVDASEPRPQAAALDGHSAEDELVTGARGAEDATVGREASSAASSTSVPSDSPHPMVQPGAEPEPSAHAASPDKVGQGSSPPDAPEDSLVREPQPSAFTAAVRAAVERAVDEPEEESRE